MSTAPRETTKAYGIVGRPLGHSASPTMHNAAFAECGLDAVYLPIETADAEEFLEVADALGLDGASVTAPAKRGIAARCSGADDIGHAPLARSIPLKRHGTGSVWHATSTCRDFSPRRSTRPTSPAPGRVR